ncbi:MAG: ribosome biogenesis GTPase [Lentisphaeria bacterium]|jgi:ribosome biogenesis GTPase
MAKRKLSKHQSRRIKQNQTASIERANSTQDEQDETLLGEEQKGRVIAHYGSQVDVEFADSASSERCHMRANVEAIVTGDNVICRKGSEMAVVVSIEPRSNTLNRPDSYGNLKPVAANIDQIIITIAPEPEAHFNLIDRYLVAAESQNLNSIILINKADLIDDERRNRFIKIRRLYSDLGYQLLEASVKQDHGLDELKACLLGKTSIFVGQSGVGKSSIIKHLLPGHDIIIGELSKHVVKGRHTTTHSRLYHFPEGGDCIDSPGIREFGLWHLLPSQVIEGFVEFRDFAYQCKFRDCSHEQEPSCALKQALREKKITAERFESYKRIIATLDDVTVKSTQHQN